MLWTECNLTNLTDKLIDWRSDWLLTDGLTNWLTDNLPGGSTDCDCKALLKGVPIKFVCMYVCMYVSSGQLINW